MQILTFDKENISTVSFERETLIVMAHTPKVIVLENDYELSKLKEVFEHLSEELDEDDYENLDIYDEEEHALRCLVDELEEEAYMIDEKEYDGRNLTIVDSSNEIDSSFDNSISVYYGVLNSGDSFLKPEQVKIIHKHFLRFIEGNACKWSTAKFLKKITDVLSDEITSYENKENFFKVSIKEKQA